MFYLDQETAKAFSRQGNEKSSKMSQFNAPVARKGGSIDVYTGILCVAFLVLAVGVALIAMKNINHSTEGNSPGGMIKLLD